MKTIADLYKDVGFTPQKREPPAWSFNNLPKADTVEPEEKKDTIDTGIDSARTVLSALFPQLAMSNMPIAKLFTGSLAEMGGNALQAIGNPDRTLAAKYNPALQGLQSTGDYLQSKADQLLEEGVGNVKPSDPDTYAGALANAVGRGLYGIGAGDTSMLHADKSATAFSRAVQQLADEENHVPLSFSSDYFLSPHGMTSDFGEVLGSMLGIAPGMAAVPESAAAKLGGNAIIKYLINSGRYGAAKAVARRAPEIVRYALGSAPKEAFSEGGHARTEALNKGISEDEATRQSLYTAALNLPVLLGGDLAQGALLGMPLLGGGKTFAKKTLEGAGRGLINAGVQGEEEIAQSAIPKALRGEEYGLTPFTATDNQLEEGKRGFGGSLPFAGLAASGHALSRANTSNDNWREGNKENISNEDFAERANLSAKQAEIWNAAQYASKRAKERFGYDIRPELIYKQWAHESGGVNFDSELARYNNNFGGLTQAEPNGEENKQPDGKNYYRQFKNAKEFANAYIDDFIKYYPDMNGVKDEREFANVLYNHSYFTDSPENYSRGMEGIEAPSKQSTLNDSDSSNVYHGNNGEMEGQTWLRQGDNVSFEGAQPNLLNAIDVLSEYYYEQTGKKLVVTSATDGSHAEGEHSHGTGWKFDINDVGGGDVSMDEDGPLTNRDGTKGWFADTFIKFGQSLGLGMNWEGGSTKAHIDVALDGTQWDGTTETENFGGFNTQKVAERTHENHRVNRQQQTEQPPQKETQPAKPQLFDITSTDSKLLPIYEEFATTKLENASRENDTADFNFFNRMFDNEGNFQATNDNLDSIRNWYGVTLSDFAETKLAEQQQKPEQIQPPTPNQSPLARKQIVINAADEFISKLRHEGDPKQAKTLLSLQRERNKGNVIEVENILKENGVNIDDPISTVQQNGHSKQGQDLAEENNLTHETGLPKFRQSQKEKLTPQERLINEIKQPIKTGKGNALRLAREKQGRAIIKFAGTNGMEIPSAELIALEKGSTKAVKKWRDKLLNSEQLNPQQQEQSPALRQKENALATRILDARKRQALIRAQLNAEKAGAYAQNKKEIQNSLDQKRAINAKENAEKLDQYQSKKRAESDLIADELQVNDELLEAEIGKFENAVTQNDRAVSQYYSQKAEINNRQALLDKEKSERKKRAKEQKKNIKAYDHALKRKFQEDAEADSSQFKSEIQDDSIGNEWNRQILFNDLLDKLDKKDFEQQALKNKEQVTREEEKRTQEEKERHREIKAQKYLDFTLNDPAISKPQREKQGRALIKLLEAPSLQLAREKIFSTTGLVKALQFGSKNAIVEAQGIIDDTLKGDQAVYNQNKITRENKLRQNLNKADFEDELDFEGELLDDRINRQEDLASLFDKDQMMPQKKTEQDAFEDELQFEDELLEDRIDRIDNSESTFKENPIQQETPTEKVKENPIRDTKKEVRGNTTTARSGSKKKYQVQYKVVEADDLTTSHKLEGLGVVKNDNFPQELQPRDRESIGMQHQPQEIGENLDAEELVDSPYINLGAPVVRNDNVVLNGNGRVLGIRYAYENVKEKVEAYKQLLAQNSEKYGLNKEKFATMKNPVLVREVPLDLTPEEIQDVIGSQTGGARMNPVETASIDAKKISANSFYSLPENGIVDERTAQGRNFLQEILTQTLNQDEINATSNSKGRINHDGATRAFRALYSIAYNDPNIISYLAGQTENSRINLASALKNAAPLIAKVKKQGEEGTLYRYDLREIADAVTKFNEIVQKKGKVEDYLNQGSLDGMGLSPETREILSFINQNRKSASKMADFFMSIAKGIEEQGEPKGKNLFGEIPTAIPLMNLIENARAEVENTSKDEEKETDNEASLFSGTGDKDTSNLIEVKDLTQAQKLLKNFGEKLGSRTQFFYNKNENFHGVHKGGNNYLNVNSKMPLSQVFWHESMHWLKNNNPELYKDLAKAVDITPTQRKEYLVKTGRKDLKSKAAIDEEIIADQMEDIAKRNGLLQNMAGKNRGLIQRVVQWLKDTMNKFIGAFHNPQGKLTTEQAIRLANEFGKNSEKWVDNKGQQIFRYNRRTHNIELNDNQDLNLSKNKNDNINIEPKYSIIEPNDNSNESTLQRIQNKIAAWFSDDNLSDRRNNRIVQRLSKLTGYKIAFGHAGLDETIVDDLQKVIRGKHAYDWQNLLPKVSEKIARELKLPSQPEVANYITNWITTGALNNTSPIATQFQKAMRDNPTKMEALNNIRNEFKEITEMTPEARYDMKILAPKKSIVKSVKEHFTKEEWLDDLAPLQKLYDRISEIDPVIAEEYKKGIDPVKMARLYRGKGGLVSTLMIHGETKNIDKIKAALKEQYPNVNWDYFKSLNMILEEAGGQKNLGELNRFAIAKLDKEMYEWNRAHPDEEQYTPTGSEKDADAIISKYEKQLSRAHRDLVSFSRTLLDIMYDSGIISADKYVSTVKKWKNYIPTMRVFDENEDFEFTKSLMQGKKTGSKRDIYSPIMKIAANAHIFVKQAERNKIKQEFASLARMGAFGEFIEERDTNKGDVKNHITFFENGKRKYLQTDPSVVRAFDALEGRSESVFFVKIIHAATNFVRAAYTSMNIDFAAGNLFRDLADSFLHNKYSSKNPMLLLTDAWTYLIRAVTNPFTGKFKSDEDFIDWIANGGSQSTLVSPDIDYVQRDVESLSTTLKERFKAHPIETIFSGLQNVAEYSEYITRLANYKRAKNALAKQRADGKATVDDKRNAALVSREASIDFAKAGRSTRVANRFFAFANAAVQSWYLDAKTFNPAKLKNAEGRKELWSAIVKLGLTAVLPAAIQFALCHDKDWWKEKKDWEKETYWFINDGIRIPKGLDVSIRFFATLTEETLKDSINEGNFDYKRLLTTIQDAAPSLTSTIVTPAIETWVNHSIFRDAPIVPKSEQHLSTWKQYGAETSSIAKWFGEKTGIAPRKLDYLINGYLGFTGKFLSGGAGGEYPIVRRFKHTPYKNPKSIQKYYELYEEQDTLYNTYKLEKEQGKKVELPKEFNPVLYRRLRQTQEKMRKLSDLQKKILDDPRLDSETREKKLEEINLKRIEICKRVINTKQ